MRTENDSAAPVTVPAARPTIGAETAARRAAALAGADSPLRPRGDGSRPNLEFVSALGRLGEAFRELRGGQRDLEERLATIGRTVNAARVDVAEVHDRLTLGTARNDTIEARLEALEERQAAALEGVDARLAALGRQVAIATGFGLSATLAIAAAFVLLR